MTINSKSLARLPVAQLQRGLGLVFAAGMALATEISQLRETPPIARDLTLAFSEDITRIEATGLPLADDVARKIRKARKAQERREGSAVRNLYGYCLFEGMSVKIIAMKEAPIRPRAILVQWQGISIKDPAPRPLPRLIS